MPSQAHARGRFPKNIRRALAIRSHLQIGPSGVFFLANYLANDASVCAMETQHQTGLALVQSPRVPEHARIPFEFDGRSSQSERLSVPAARCQLASTNAQFIERGPEACRVIAFLRELDFQREPLAWSSRFQFP